MGIASKLALLSTLLVGLAVLYQQKVEFDFQRKVEDIHNGLLRAEEKVPVLHKPKVAIGFGGCWDGFVPDAPGFLRDVMGLDPSGNMGHHNTIDSMEALEELWTYFFSHGAAVERFVQNETVYKELVQGVKDLKDARWAIGGNAPIMANRMAAEGCEVLLGWGVADAQGKLHPKIKVMEPEDEGDLHLIFEYKVGDQWGDVVTPRANRMILHHDVVNPNLYMLERFGESVQQYDPRLLVVGGLQMMDNFPFAAGVRESRLDQVEEMLRETPRRTRIHFEMASYSEEKLMNELTNKVIPYADSLGMNEQELPNLVSVLSDGSTVLISDAYPRVATVLDHLRVLMRELKTREGPHTRPCTRVHVHTLAYQVILTVKGKWKNTMSAAAKASLVANRHVCNSKEIDLEKVKLLLDDSFATSRKDGSDRIQVLADHPVSCWEEGEYEICLAPNLVCTDVYVTAGGGDNISAGSLSVQI